MSKFFCRHFELREIADPFFTFCFYATSVNQALVYIRRKLMCNSLQLVGVVHPYYAATRRVSCETENEAVKIK